MLESHQTAFTMTVPAPVEDASDSLDDSFLVDLNLDDLPRPAGFSQLVQVGLGQEGLQDALTVFGVTVPEDFVIPPAVHLPGVGTLLKSDPEVENDPVKRAEQLGQAAGEAGLWPALTAQFLGMPYGDGESLALAAALHRTWMLAEAGWLE